MLTNGCRYPFFSASGKRLFEKVCCRSRKMNQSGNTCFENSLHNAETTAVWKKRRLARRENRPKRQHYRRDSTPSMNHAAGEYAIMDRDVGILRRMGVWDPWNGSSDEIPKTATLEWIPNAGGIAGKLPVSGTKRLTGRFQLPEGADFDLHSDIQSSFGLLRPYGQASPHGGDQPQ